MKTLNPQRLREKIEARMADDIANARVGGATLIVQQGGKLVYQGTFFDPQVGAVQPDSIYRLASMTKPVVAAAVMIARDEGLLNLDDPLAKYLPDFAEMTIGRLNENNQPVPVRRAEGPITLRHLLTHSSGLGSDMLGGVMWDNRPEACRTLLANSVDFYASTLLAFEPGTATAYSPAMGFDVLGRVVEVVSGMSLAEFFKARIFQPLGMTDTTFEPTDAQWQRFVPMHNRVDGKPAVQAMGPGCVFEGVPASCYCGGGGLAAAAGDYARFAEMLLWGKGILKPETLAEMATPQLPPEIMGGEQVWGLGMRVITKESYRDLPVGAYGWSGAYGTHFWVDPVNQITAVYLKNSLYDGGAGCVTGRNFERDVTDSLMD